MENRLLSCSSLALTRQPPFSSCFPCNFDRMFKLCARQINPSTYKEIIKNEMRCGDDTPKQYKMQGRGFV